MSCQADAANAHSRWRRELAERYAVGYRQVPAVRAVLLTGWVGNRRASRRRLSSNSTSAMFLSRVANVLCLMTAPAADDPGPVWIEGRSSGEPPTQMSSPRDNAAGKSIPGDDVQASQPTRVRYASVLATSDW